MSHHSAATTNLPDMNLPDVDSLEHRVDQWADFWFVALLRAEHVNNEASQATLLAWLIGLPVGLDPATAANAVLNYQRAQEQQFLSTSLTALLQQVATYPADRLARLRPSRRRITAH